MNKLPIKLLVLDMDGTSYYFKGPIIKGNIKAIQDAEKAGVKVVFVTGRPALHPLSHFIENGFGKNEESFVVACNGGITYDFISKKVLARNSISEELTKKVFELKRKPEFKNVGLRAYCDDMKTHIDSQIDHVGGYQPYFNDKSFRGERIGWENYISYADAMKDWHYSASKIVIDYANDDFIKAIKNLGLEIAYSKEPDGSYNGEVNAPGINKATVVEDLAKKFNISKDEIMTIGDGPNDVPMIKWAKYSVSIGNSNPEVKKYASIHTDTIAEDGAVAEIIDKYILGDK